MDNQVLRKVQLVQFEILNEVDRICKEHSLSYYLYYGTLLGAIRHNGFIPWDDDLDIAMMRDDYDKLMSILPNSLQSQYWLQSYKTDEEYWLPFAKIRKKGTVFKEKGMENDLDNKSGIWIDVFPLDNSNKLLFVTKIRNYLIKTITYSLKQRRFGLRLFDFSKRYIPTMMMWAVLSNKTLKSIQEKLLISKRPSDYCVCLPGTQNVERKRFSKEWFCVNYHEFEDGQFPVPEKYDEILKKMYGDFMKIPPLDQRSSHNVIEVIVS